MNKILVGLIVGALISSTSISYADGVVIPMSIKVEAFKKDIKSHGLNLDGGDEADGEIHNNGNSMKVITFKPVTPAQLELIKDAASRNVRN